MPPFIEKATLDKVLLSALRPKFFKVGASMREMLDLVFHKPRTFRRFGGPVNKMVGMKELLDCFSEDLKPIDRSWAHDALDKALIVQEKQASGEIIKPALPYRPCGGMPLPLPWACIPPTHTLYGTERRSPLLSPRDDLLKTFPDMSRLSRSCWCCYGQLAC